MKSIRAITLVLLSATLTSCSIDKQQISALVAKEMCSCLYLVEQSEANCKKAIGPSLLIAKYTLNKKLKQVIGSSKEGAAPVTFRYASARYGCELVR